MVIRREHYTLSFSWRLVPTIPMRVYIIVKQRMKRLVNRRIIGSSALLRKTWEYIVPFYFTERDE